MPGPIRVPHVHAEDWSCCIDLTWRMPVSDSETRCRFPRCTAVYHPSHQPGETGWQFASDEPDDVPAHDHYGSAL
jgi:hypothetical protein